jgi:hypothetical protein
LFIVKALPVVNDAAERAVKLMQEFHDKFSNDGDQNQAIFQTVSYYRQKSAKIPSNQCQR